MTLKISFTNSFAISFDIGFETSDIIFSITLFPIHSISIIPFHPSIFLNDEVHEWLRMRIIIVLTSFLRVKEK